MLSREGSTMKRPWDHLSNGKGHQKPRNGRRRQRFQFVLYRFVNRVHVVHMLNQRDAHRGFGTLIDRIVPLVP